MFLFRFYVAVIGCMTRPWFVRLLGSRHQNVFGMGVDPRPHLLSVLVEDRILAKHHAVFVYHQKRASCIQLVAARPMPVTQLQPFSRAILP